MTYIGLVVYIRRGFNSLAMESGDAYDGTQRPGLSLFPTPRVPLGGKSATVVVFDIDGRFDVRGLSANLGECLDIRERWSFDSAYRRMESHLRAERARSS